MNRKPIVVTSDSPYALSLPNVDMLDDHTLQALAGQTQTMYAIVRETNRRQQALSLLHLYALQKVDETFTAEGLIRAMSLAPLFLPEHEAFEREQRAQYLDAMQRILQEATAELLKRFIDGGEE